MPRIAHVISTPSGIGGAERVLQALTEGGEGRAWRQLVLNPFASEGGSGLGSVLPAGTVYRERVTTRLTQVLSARRWTRNHLEQFRPDIVHVHLYHASVLVASLSSIGERCRILSHHHGNQIAILKGQVSAFLDRHAGRRYDLVIAVSDRVRQYLVEECGYALSKVATVPNGWFGQPLPRCPEGDGQTIICVENFRTEKRHDLLLEVFSLLHVDMPKVRLMLVGSGPREAYLRLRARELGVSSEVEFVGWVDNVWPYLASADLFVSATSQESFGIAFLEAMAAGLPVVAFDGGPDPGLVESGKTGLLVPGGDVGAMAASVQQLLGNSEARNAMGFEAEDKAKAFSSEKMVGSYFDIYDTLLKDLDVRD